MKSTSTPHVTSTAPPTSSPQASARPNAPPPSSPSHIPLEYFSLYNDIRARTGIYRGPQATRQHRPGAGSTAQHQHRTELGRKTCSHSAHQISGAHPDLSFQPYVQTAVSDNVLGSPRLQDNMMASGLESGIRPGQENGIVAGPGNGIQSGLGRGTLSARENGIRAALEYGMQSELNRIQKSGLKDIQRSELFNLSRCGLDDGRWSPVDNAMSRDAQVESVSMREDRQRTTNSRIPLPRRSSRPVGTLSSDSAEHRPNEHRQKESSEMKRRRASNERETESFKKPDSCRFSARSMRPYSDPILRLASPRVPRPCIDEARCNDTQLLPSTKLVVPDSGQCGASSNRSNEPGSSKSFPAVGNNALRHKMEAGETFRLTNSPRSFKLVRDDQIGESSYHSRSFRAGYEAGCGMLGSPRVDNPTTGSQSHVYVTPRDVSTEVTCSGVSGRAVSAKTDELAAYWLTTQQESQPIESRAELPLPTHTPATTQHAPANHHRSLIPVPERCRQQESIRERQRYSQRQDQGHEQGQGHGQGQGQGQSHGGPRTSQLPTSDNRRPGSENPRFRTSQKSLPIQQRRITKECFDVKLADIMEREGLQSGLGASPRGRGTSQRARRTPGVPNGPLDRHRYPCTPRYGMAAHDSDGMRERMQTCYDEDVLPEPDANKFDQLLRHHGTRSRALHGATACPSQPSRRDVRSKRDVTLSRLTEHSQALWCPNELGGESEARNSYAAQDPRHPGFEGKAGGSYAAPDPRHPGFEGEPGGSHVTLGPSHPGYESEAGDSPGAVTRSSSSTGDGPSLNSIALANLTETSCPKTRLPVLKKTKKCDAAAIRKLSSSSSSTHLKVTGNHQKSQYRTTATRDERLRGAACRTATVGKQQQQHVQSSGKRKETGRQSKYGRPVERVRSADRMDSVDSVDSLRVEASTAGILPHRGCSACNQNLDRTNANSRGKRSAVNHSVNKPRPQKTEQRPTVRLDDVINELQLRQQHQSPADRLFGPSNESAEICDGQLYSTNHRARSRYVNQHLGAGKSSAATRTAARVDASEFSDVTRRERTGINNNVITAKQSENCCARNSTDMHINPSQKPSNSTRSDEIVLSSRRVKSPEGRIRASGSVSALGHGQGQREAGASVPGPLSESASRRNFQKTRTIIMDKLRESNFLAPRRLQPASEDPAPGPRGEAPEKRSMYRSAGALRVDYTPPGAVPPAANVQHEGNPGLERNDASDEDSESFATSWTSFQSNIAEGHEQAMTDHSVSLQGSQSALSLFNACCETEPSPRLAAFVDHVTASGDTASPRYGRDPALSSSLMGRDENSLQEGRKPRSIFTRRQDRTQDIIANPCHQRFRRAVRNETRARRVEKRAERENQRRAIELTQSRIGYTRFFLSLLITLVKMFGGPFRDLLYTFFQASSLAGDF